MKNKQIIIRRTEDWNICIAILFIKKSQRTKKARILLPEHITDENDISGGHSKLDIKKIISEFLESDYHTLILSSESYWMRIQK